MNWNNVFEHNLTENMIINTTSLE